MPKWIQFVVMTSLAGCGGHASSPSNTVAPVGEPASPGPSPSPSPSPSVGAVCGTRGVAACAANEFCNYQPGAQCGESDHPGHCMVRPEFCTDIYQPVCGCDDKEYGNGCSAATAGVGVKSDGQCP